MISETQSDAVFWNRCYEPDSIKRDSEIKEHLLSHGANVKSFNSYLLFEPHEIKNKANSYFKVFTPFWRSCNINHQPRTLYRNAEINHYDTIVKSDDLNSWNLLPNNPNWADKFSQHWQPGEHNAQKLLSQFLEQKSNEYSKNRDIPGIEGTSKLSPHLHFGEISPHQVWHQAQHHANKTTEQNGLNTYLAEIGWREFSYHLLYYNQNLPSQEFNIKFKNFPWEQDSSDLAKWQKGLTGYPIIDAGMRELWSTGWMHNRVRMITASFLTKHLLIPWQEGAKWFLDTLLDADLASNSSGWQWVAGCGADASPYFRIFNPILQGTKFDPSGEYIRKWIPEISTLPDKYINTPWKASKELLNTHKITLGKDYPEPIIDHTFARNRALELYKSIK